MKDKLRELAERWKSKARIYPANSEAEFSHNRCADELLAILDAEGDGGAAPVVRRLLAPNGKPYGVWDSLCKAPLPEEMAREGWSYQVAYTHPARSGVVIDEDVGDIDVDRACDAYMDASPESAGVCAYGMLAALKHFAKGSKANAMDAARYRWLRSSTSEMYVHRPHQCALGLTSLDKAIDAAIQGATHDH